MVPPGPCALYPLLRDVCTRQDSRLSIRVRFAEGLSYQAASRLRRSHVSPPRTHTWRSCCSLSVAVMPIANGTLTLPPLLFCAAYAGSRGPRCYSCRGS